eukprot:1161348-Pelagomonas_calceolata.AAC.12
MLQVAFIIFALLRTILYQDTGKQKGNAEPDSAVFTKESEKLLSLSTAPSASLGMLGGERCDLS